MRCNGIGLRLACSVPGESHAAIGRHLRCFDMGIQSQCVMSEKPKHHTIGIEKNHMLIAGR